MLWEGAGEGSRGWHVPSRQPQAWCEPRGGVGGDNLPALVTEPHGASAVPRFISQLQAAGGGRGAARGKQQPPVPTPTPSKRWARGSISQAPAPTLAQLQVPKSQMCLGLGTSPGPSGTVCVPVRGPRGPGPCREKRGGKQPHVWPSMRSTDRTRPAEHGRAPPSPTPANPFPMSLPLGTGARAGSGRLQPGHAKVRASHHGQGIGYQAGVVSGPREGDAKTASLLPAQRRKQVGSLARAAALPGGQQLFRASSGRCLRRKGQGVTSPLPPFSQPPTEALQSPRAPGRELQGRIQPEGGSVPSNLP